MLLWYIIILAYPFSQINNQFDFYFSMNVKSNNVSKDLQEASQVDFLEVFQEAFQVIITSLIESVASSINSVWDKTLKNNLFILGGMGGMPGGMGGMPGGMGGMPG